jgi:hypothetical protein
LTASYNALTAVVIEDVIKVVISRFSKNNAVLNAQIHLRIIQFLREFQIYLTGFCKISVIFQLLRLLSLRCCWLSWLAHLVQ